jgi:hypothetical protein
VSAITGATVGFTDTEPCRLLAQLDAAELEGLYSVLHAGADASDDEAVSTWCTRMGRLLVAECYRRIYEQAVINAKAAAIDAEERRLACPGRPVPELRSAPRWAQVSLRPE